MTVEQIAVRQEVRQMLSEAGINKTTLKEMVKGVLAEELEKAVKQAFAEYDVEGRLNKFFNSNVESLCKAALSEDVRNEVRQKLWDMKIEIKI